MKISHQQARQRFEAALDTAHYYRRKPELDRDLAEHLAGCRECRAYTEQAAAIDARLAQQLPQSCDAPHPSSPKIDAAIRKVQSRARRKRMIRFMTTTTRRIALLAGSLVLVAGFIFLLNKLFINLPVPLGNPTSTSTAPVVDDNNVRNEENDPKDVTITFAASVAEKSIYQPLMEAFHQEHPNITVQFVKIDPSTQMDAQQQASAADISLLSGRPNLIAGASYFRDLTSMMETDTTFQAEDFWPNALTGCQDQEGDSYGVPINLYMLGILYDPAALDAAGLAHPQSGWTWDDFRQLVSAISPGQNLSRQYSFVDLSVHKDAQTSAITYLLAPVIDAYLGQQNGAIDLAIFPATVQWYLDLVQAKRIFPVTETDKSDAYQALFQDGAPVLMIGATNSWIGNDFALSKYNMAPFPIQSLGEGNATTPIIAACGVISAGSNHPQEAWQWLNYLSHQWIHGNEQLVYINQSVPARRSVVNNNPYWENIPVNAQEAYRFGLEHGWYGSAYPNQLWAITQALIESTDRGTPFADALQSKMATIPVENSPSKPNEPVVVATPRPSRPDASTIRFYSDQVFQDEEKYKRLVEGFLRDHPEIEVELPSPWNPVDNPGNGDDRFYFPAEKYDCFEMDLPDLSTRDLSVIQDVNTWLDQDATLRADFFPGQLDAYAVDGRVYGLPASMSPNLMFYNKTLLNRLGIELPKSDWTFDEFIRIATAASTTLEGQKVYGFAPYANRDVGFLLAGRGVEWISLNGSYPQAHLNDPSVVDAYRWMDNLRQAGVLFPTTFMDSSEAIQNALTAGHLAFWTAESTPWGGWYFNPMEKIPYEIGAVPLPNTPLLNTANNPGMTGLFISSKSQNAQACWTWMRYLSEQPEAFSGVSARRSVAESPGWEATVGAERATIYRAALEQNDGALRPTSWENNVLTSMFSYTSGALQEIFAGTDAGVALSTAQRRADFVPQCLEQANYLNLPARDREEVVNSCLQQAGSVR